jgi:phenylpropionate dioxygenase-like ring-hydroxylating dioxygenase large terminal subunit
VTIAESEAQESSEFPPDQYAPGANPLTVQAKVPFAMTDPLYVPRERYYDREFFELEKKHVWTKNWQMAARLEEIPNPGDYTEYEIVGNSILIVRQPDGSVKALHNACRHRATELAKGQGRLPGGQLVCPFHGWRWHLDGSNSFVFMDCSFDPSTLKPDDLRLREAKVEIWAGMVWINLDLDAPPLAEALAPMQGMLDSVGLGNMKVKWWKQVVLNANWKLTMEAFLEAYHVMQTHPQLQMGKGDAYAEVKNKFMQYTAFRGGHGRFASAYVSGGDNMQTFNSAADWDFEDFIEFNRLFAQGQDGMALDRDVQIFEGVRNKVGPDDPDFQAKAIEALYEYAAGAGIPMVPPGEHTRLWGAELFLFPNSFFLPMYANALVYRMRPHHDNPEWCLMDVWSLTTYPIGHEPERAELLGVFDKDDDEHWALIPRQDFSNIERQQRGLHSQGFKEMRLSAQYENTIANLHQQLDRVIAVGEA